jgi:hypothetical protein
LAAINAICTCDTSPTRPAIPSITGISTYAAGARIGHAAVTASTGVTASTTFTASWTDGCCGCATSTKATVAAQPAFSRCPSFSVPGDTAHTAISTGPTVYQVYSSSLRQAFNTASPSRTAKATATTDYDTGIADRQLRAYNARATRTARTTKATKATSARIARDGRKGTIPTVAAAPANTTDATGYADLGVDRYQPVRAINSSAARCPGPALATTAANTAITCIARRTTKAAITAVARKTKTVSGTAHPTITAVTAIWPRSILTIGARNAIRGGIIKQLRRDADNQIIFASMRWKNGRGQSQGRG